MQRAYMLLISGVWLAVLPYLGFPHSWKNILTALTGLGFVCASFVLYKELKKNQKEGGAFENFKENEFGSEEEKK